MPAHHALIRPGLVSRQRYGPIAAHTHSHTQLLQHIHTYRRPIAHTHTHTPAAIGNVHIQLQFAPAGFTAAALDLVQLERLTMTLGSHSGTQQCDLMMAVARVALDDTAVKDAAVSRLQQTGLAALPAAFFYTIGMLWRNLPTGHPQINNAIQFSFMNFQAASEVGSCKLSLKCSVLQCVAVCCSVLQCVAVCCSAVAS